MTAPAGTLNRTSALLSAGSPCRTAISQPSGMNAGQGPHLSCASLNASARAGSAATAAVRANWPVSASTMAEPSCSAVRIGYLQRSGLTPCTTRAEPSAGRLRAQQQPHVLADVSRLDDRHLQLLGHR